MKKNIGNQKTHRILVMSPPIVYFENLSLLTFLFSLIRYNLFNNSTSKESKTMYFIDASLLAKICLIPILRFLGKNVNQLHFQMLEIVDTNGELVRTRIPRKDLFDFQDKILNSEGYKSLYHRSWKKDSINEYINKGLIYGEMKYEDSVGRVLFIINVVFWHMQKSDFKQSVFITNNRPWIDLYQEYAEQYKIELLSTRSAIYKLSDLKRIIRSSPWLFNKLKNIKYMNLNKKVDSQNIFNKKLYIEGRGDLNLSDDGYHSDFFWQLNSKFLLQNILYKYHSVKEKEYLSKHGVFSIGEGVYSDRRDSRKYKKPELNYSYRYRKESKVVQTILDSYNFDRFNWASLFKQHGVKIFLTWYKYSNHHMAFSDAIRDNGGISVVWQMAFDGFKDTACVSKSDVVFSFSKFSDEIEKQLESKIKYNVIVGYPKDYAPPLLKDKANKLREKLKANGAKKIVFVIDENSLNDSRWHTGHELQRENYSYILQKVLEIPWLGAVFKPKVAKTLRQRLGPVADLLKKAEKTGRCHIYENSGRHHTSAPPILAGLSADICIHGHLSAGTAGLECALEGIPTLLIDREGTPYSKLYDLPEGQVIFKDWPSTIDALMEHFNSPEGISGFGDWSSVINDLDPFRDGMAAYRMGTYLQWLIDGFENNLDREVVMANAAEKYKKQWGEDKVIAS